MRDDPREQITWGGLPAAPKAFALGEIFFAKKDGAKARECFEAALPVIERSVREAPLDADHHMALANVYAGLGRTEEAIREGQRACELLPESKDAWLGVWMADNLADLYVRVGEPELALQLVEHSVSVPAGKHVAQLRVDPLWERCATIRVFKSCLVRRQVKPQTTKASPFCPLKASAMRKRTPISPMESRMTF